MKESFTLAHVERYLDTLPSPDAIAGYMDQTSVSEDEPHETNYGCVVGNAVMFVAGASGMSCGFISASAHFVDKAPVEYRLDAQVEALILNLGDLDEPRRPTVREVRDAIAKIRGA